MEIIDTIKEMDPVKLKKYIVILVIVGILIFYPDIWIGLINTFLGLAGIGGIQQIPAGFWFMIFAVVFFGFALFLTMILQKKKQRQTTQPKDIIQKGFCDICNNPKAKNVLPMDYNEDGNVSKIFVCEKCRNEVKEMKKNADNWNKNMDDERRIS